MIKVILADTDKNNIKNFRNFIQLNHPEFNIVGDADNEQDIYALIEKTDARLVISDMQLSNITAFQLFKDITNNYPDVKMILYLSFGELQYGKLALADGLISYIVKPVKPVELSNSLNRAIEVFDELDQHKQAHQNLIVQYEQHLPVFEDRFLINLVHGHLENNQEILNNINYFNMNLTSGYTALIIKVNNFNKISLALDEREKQIFMFSLLNTVKEYLAALNNGTAFINHFHCITVILGNNLDLSELISIADSIKSKLQNTTVTIGIGKTYSNLNEICISYRQAKSALRYESRMGVGSIIPITYVEPDNHITYRFPLKKEELLVYTVVVGDNEKAQRLLSEIFDALKSCGELPDKLLPKIILDILVSINRYASEQKISINDVFSKVFSVSIISEKNSNDEAYEYLKKAIEQLTLHINENRKDQDDKILDIAKKYADTYYFESISLSKTAQYAQTTPDYLNRLFENNLGKSFYDYSVQVRIEKAKYFILETDLSDREIAKKVGYDEARHFSRIFYTYENDSLESFRRKYKSESM